MNKERRLGRGLEALLGRPAEKADEAGGATATQEPSHQLPVDQIDRNPWQPRKEFDQEEIAELAKSIELHGVLQPMVVRPHDGRYQLVAGERRMLACRSLNWAEVPVRIVHIDDRQMAEVAMVENLHRRDLNPLEKAAAFQSYLQSYKCSKEELATRIGVDRSTVANLIRLLELPRGVQEAVQCDRVSAGHARALLPLGDEKEQEKFCRRIQAEGLSVRNTEQLVRELIEETDGYPLETHTAGSDSAPAPSAAPKPARTKSEHLLSLEQELRSALGTKVDIRQIGKEKGRIVIHFSSHEEFEQIRQWLGKGGA